MLALFIGVGVSSIAVLLMQFLPLNYFTLVGILYLYSVVAVVVAYVVRRDLLRRGEISSEKTFRNPINRTENNWVTIHTYSDEMLRGSVKEASEDFLWMKYAFPLKGKLRIIEDMFLRYGEIRRVEVD